MLQVYCDGENGVNKFLAKYDTKINVKSVIPSLNEQGELITVVYHTEKPLDVDLRS
jgi:hypothetical protein